MKTHLEISSKAMLTRPAVLRALMNHLGLVCSELSAAWLSGGIYLTSGGLKLDSAAQRRIMYKRVDV